MEEIKEINENKLYRAKEITELLSLSATNISKKMAEWIIPSVSVSSWKRKVYRIKWSQLIDYIKNL